MPAGRSSSGVLGPRSDCVPDHHLPTMCPAGNDRIQIRQRSQDSMINLKRGAVAMSVTAMLALAPSALASGGVNSGGVNSGGSGGGGGGGGTTTTTATSTAPTSCATISSFSNSTGYYS